jgi:hypothetical protein
MDIAVPTLWRAPNTPSGGAALCKKLVRSKQPYVVCEAKRHYGRLLAQTMNGAGVALSAAHTRQVGDSTRATGQMAKT